MKIYDTLRWFYSQQYVIYFPKLAHLLGGVNPALLFSFLAFWSNNKEGEEVYATIEDVRERTGLSRSEQETAIQKLKSLGLVETKVRGVPPRRYFRLFPEKLNELISTKKTEEQEEQSEDDAQINVQKNGKSICGISANQFAENKQINLQKSCKLEIPANIKNSMTYGDFSGDKRSIEIKNKNNSIGEQSSQTQGFVSVGEAINKFLSNPQTIENTKQEDVKQSKEDDMRVTMSPKVEDFVDDLLLVFEQEYRQAFGREYIVGNKGKDRKLVRKIYDAAMHNKPPNEKAYTFFRRVIRTCFEQADDWERERMDIGFFVSNINRLLGKFEKAERERSEEEEQKKASVRKVAKVRVIKPEDYFKLLRKKIEEGQ